MKWYDDITEELSILLLSGLAVAAFFFDAKEIAAMCVGALATYLKKEKGRNGNHAPEQVKEG